MDIARIIYRIFVNLVKDIPFTPRKLRATLLLRRRASASHLNELERLDRIRNPSKYRGV